MRGAGWEGRDKKMYMLVSGAVDLRCGSVVLTVARWRGESNINWGDMVRSGATCA